MAHIATDNGVKKVPAKGSSMSKTNRVNHQSFTIVIALLLLLQMLMRSVDAYC